MNLFNKGLANYLRIDTLISILYIQQPNYNRENSGKARGPRGAEGSVTHSTSHKRGPY